MKNERISILPTQGESNPIPKAIVANNIHGQSVENESEPKVHFEEFGESQ